MKEAFVEQKSREMIAKAAANRPEYCKRVLLRAVENVLLSALPTSSPRSGIFAVRLRYAPRLETASLQLRKPSKLLFDSLLSNSFSFLYSISSFPFSYLFFFLKS